MSKRRRSRAHTQLYTIRSVPHPNVGDNDGLWRYVRLLPPLQDFPRAQWVGKINAQVFDQVDVAAVLLMLEDESKPVAHHHYDVARVDT